MTGLAPPKVLRTQRSIQSSYEAPHKVHTATTYPVSSPNGSTIIIYGHDNGVRLVWRGGKQFKEPAEKQGEKPSAANGASSVAVFVLDSDDEDDADSGAPTFEDEPEFEEEEDDPSASSSPAIIQHLDLSFGTSGLRLAVPAIPMTSHNAASQLRPGILSQMIVFAVVCGDLTTRLIILPLTPPSPASKSRKELFNTPTSGKAGDGKWGESVAILAGHHAIADALSFIFQPAAASMGNIEDASSRWNVMLASHSREIRGLLLIYSIPIASALKKDKAQFFFPAKSFEPLQRQYLSSPAISICFKPLPQSMPPSTQLLLAHTSGMVKVYEPSPAPGPSAPVSNNTAFQGEWMLTLYAGFSSGNGDAPDSSMANYGRKSILDAKWVLSGQAIMVLLSDGEWGIWDVGGSGPKHGMRSELRGGAYTPFTISGLLEGTTKSSTARNALSQQNNASKFAPLTPGTRRTVETTLFHSRSNNHGNNNHGSVRGQLVVTRLPSTAAALQGNECVILWLQESFAVIPNLWSFWDAHVRRSDGGSNPFGGGLPAGNTRMMKIETVDLRGERCTAMDQFPKDRSALSSSNAVPLDLLITGEHCFVLVSDTRGNPMRLRSERENHNASVAEGNTDVGRIDRALSRMEAENGAGSGTGAVRRDPAFLR